MARPFFERLKKYFFDVGQVLLGEADAAAIFPNSGDIGTSREAIYAAYLQQHLPSSCNVSLGGFLFDQTGRESNQIDIIVTNQVSIQFNSQNPDGSGKSFASIDGAIAVVSVKSTLDSAQLRDALRNLASLPDKEPLTDKLKSPIVVLHGYDNWPYKIIYANTGVSRDTLSETLEEFYRDNPEIPENKRPNLIHVNGRYVVVRSGPNGAETRDKTKIPPNTFYGFDDATNVFGLFYAITEIQNIALGSSHIRYRYSDLINNIDF